MWSTLHDILSATDNTGERKIFGGLTVALGGDFRNILPVVKRGKREDIIAASLSRSEIWKYCEVLNLTENMRLQNLSNNDDNANFVSWVLKIEDGDCTTLCTNIDSDDKWIQIPSELRIDADDDAISLLISFVYDNSNVNIKNDSYFRNRGYLLH
ncbi:hypothetical protein AAC387_Pa03g2026 [Persea americana]